MMVKLSGIFILHILWVILIASPPPIESRNGGSGGRGDQSRMSRCQSLLAKSNSGKFVRSLTYWNSCNRCTCYRTGRDHGGKRDLGWRTHCTRKRCVDGRWSNWSAYTRCSKRCSGGRQSRRRSCTNPRPGPRGKRCRGSSYQKRNCNVSACSRTDTCSDSRKYAWWCPRWRKYCSSKYQSWNKWLLKNCKKTCGLCGGTPRNPGKPANSNFLNQVLSRSNVRVDKRMLGILGSKNDAKINALLSILLRKKFNKSGIGIRINKGDVIVSKKFPDQYKRIGKCKYRIYARNLRATGTIKRSSSFSTRANLISKVPNVLFQARIDAGLRVSGSIRGEYRRKFLWKCRRILRKTIGLNINSGGTVAIAAKLNAKQFRLKKVGSKNYELTLQFGLKLDGKVIRWNINDVRASRCKIKIFGIRIASYCGLVEKYVKKYAQRYVNKVSDVQAPKLVKKLESKLQAKVGKVLKIKIRLP